ncbi:response regulator transcription factor [candidate division WOR-3 bacterium]|nr:response regulator transcription factor [candidate division WOR-3 bacterium]
MYNIFIADDHTIIRQGLSRIIEEVSGYKIIGETGDGLQILPLVRELKPDMIILDISMPNLRGIEAIHKIKRVIKKIKILVLTMHKNEDYVYECLTSGAHAYILKEDADTELITAIKSLRQDNVYVSSSFTGDVIKKLVQRKSDAYDKKGGAVFKILTNREREILKLIAEGNSNKKLAMKLGISIRTVEHHRLSIMRKLDLSNIVDLVKYAIKTGLIDLT